MKASVLFNHLLFIILFYYKSHAEFKLLKSSLKWRSLNIVGVPFNTILSSYRGPHNMGSLFSPLPCRKQGYHD